MFGWFNNSASLNNKERNFHLAVLVREAPDTGSDTNQYSTGDPHGADTTHRVRNEHVCSAKQRVHHQHEPAHVPQHGDNGEQPHGDVEQSVRQRHVLLRHHHAGTVSNTRFV